MKLFLIFNLLAFGLLVNGVETLGGCINPACNYCESLAASCQDAATGSLSGTDCLCTQRFKVNLSRCLAGVICAWDGTGSATLPVCPDIYCPGNFDQSFINQCPGVSITGPPYPLPTAAPGQTSTISTQSNGASQTVTSGSSSGTGTSTTTRTTGSNSVASASATTSIGSASTVKVPLGLVGVLALAVLLHL